ncbi:MAG: exonuclease domain-containing protein [Corynebacterium camporealensis]|uniref:exonuclease domain-containing protein n=1 Tax=Corynebacterium camporealensis TaxID=161896 RepID=UPI002A90EE91|nr:exonuclease domain-containing protein [Corynebacterium camporealensis]MDY5839113.1 exonuclease domain-containing protein [Corynebacterium camporealensis]
MPYHAHGARIDVTGEAIVLERTLLATSLGQPARESLPVSDITGVEVHAPSTRSFGEIYLEGIDRRLRFAPHQEVAAKACADAINAALRGEAPPTPDSLHVTGLDFTAVDVETANDNWGSICQIGAVRFRDGEEVDARTWLCTPPPGLEDFAEVNISIHGITADDVSDAPDFATCAAELFVFLGDDIMVAHNAQFDATALRSGLRTAGADVPEVTCACSLALSRDASKAKLIDVANHKLPTVTKVFSDEDFQHHEATADARAAGIIISGLAQRYGHTGSIEDLFTNREFSLGKITADAVLPVLRAHTAPLSGRDLGAGTDFRDPKRSAWESDESPKKSSKSQSKKSSGPAPWQAVATPDTIPEPNEDADPTGKLYGQNVTLTGEFAPFDKGQLWSGIAECGGQVAKNVTKKTTMLVVGEWGKKTSKEKRAEELNEKGQDITIWSAQQLLEELGLDEQPPF